MFLNEILRSCLRIKYIDKILKYFNFKQKYHRLYLIENKVSFAMLLYGIINTQRFGLNSNLTTTHRISFNSAVSFQWYSLKSNVIVM